MMTDRKSLSLNSDVLVYRLLQVYWDTQPDLYTASELCDSTKHKLNQTHM